MTEQITAIKERLLASSRVLILCHEKPDGDTLGSAAALRFALKAKGIAADFSAGDPVTPKYAYLAKEGYVEKPEDDYDCIISVDVAEEGMLGNNVPFSSRLDAVIDHHRTNDGFGKLNFIDPKAAATGELIFLLIKEIGVSLSEEICLSLYTALSTDTGCFRFTNTTERTLFMAAEIYATGFRPGQLSHELFDMKSRSRIDLERAILDRLVYGAEGRVVVATLPLELREELGVSEDDLDGVSSMLRSIEGTFAAALLKENTKGVWKASLRSGEQIDVSAVCAALGGGGHARAAGCSIEGEEKEAAELIMRELVAACPKA